MAQRIAIMGLGIMGSGMASNLIQAGFPLSVYNRSAGRAEPLAAMGARVGATPREAAAGAEIVISMVADDAASRDVWLGKDGAMAGSSPGALFIECSTLTVDWIRELGESARREGHALLDAPVTGSKPQAAEGQLLFLVGGSEEALERAGPVFRAMGREAVHVGPSGSGALIKLVNNFLVGVQAAALAEALALIEKGGLERDRALEILLGGAVASPIMRTLSARMVAKDFDPPNFALELMTKDLTYAEREGALHNAPLTTGTAARRLFEAADEAGFGKSDLAAVCEPIR